MLFSVNPDIALNTSTCSPNTGTLTKFEFAGIAVISDDTDCDDLRIRIRIAPGANSMPFSFVN